MQAPSSAAGAGLPTGSPLQDAAAPQVLSATVPAPLIHRQLAGCSDQLQRFAIPASFAPAESVEADLLAIWQELLGQPAIGLHDDFFACGGHSLLAMQLSVRIYDRFQVELPVVRLFALPTVAEQAAAVTAALATAGNPRERTPLHAHAAPPGPLPLSFEQERMWLLHQLLPDSPAYHTFTTVRLKGKLNVARWQQCIATIVQRHTILRTKVVLLDGEPHQVVDEQMTAPVTVLDLRSLPAAEREAAARKQIDSLVHEPFDLAHGPLVRAGVYQVGDEDHLFVLSIHHFAADAWTLDLFAEELARLYVAASAGETLAATQARFQYADYVLWQQERRQTGWPETGLERWRQRLAAVPALALPIDHARPAQPSGRGGMVELNSAPELMDRLRRWSRQEGVTLFVTLMAAFEVLLYRRSGQDDFAVGMPIANRPTAEAETIYGSFMNTAILRADLGGNPTFRTLLHRVQAAAHAAYADQDLPFEKLAASLQPARDLSYAPLFQVMCNGINLPLPSARCFGLPWEPVILHPGSSQVDLALSIVDSDNHQFVALEYNADLFAHSTVERMLAEYAVLLAGILENPDCPIATLPLLPSAEQQLLAAWNATAAAYPHDLCVHQLFEQQVRRTPDALAVTAQGVSLTYAALDQRAETVASHLRALGVGPNVFVGLCLERSVDMVAAVLGILKAGGAYLPLDPKFPPDRLAYMIEDAGAPVLITQRDVLPELVAAAAGHAKHVLYLDALGDAPATAVSPATLAGPDDLAYIIYTSGSTGRPKGVQLGHRGVVNFLCSMQREPGLAASDVLLSVTTLSFDIHVLELLLPLITGAHVVVATAEQALDGAQLGDLLKTCGATVMQATPATWRMLLAQGWPGASGLKALCGGEALTGDLAQALLARVGALWNLYGPTETTVWSTVYRVTEVTDTVPIGHPIANTQVYLLDGAMQPAPIGVAAELYIGGDGVAQGYLNRAELTAERFVPDPFSHQPGARLYRTGDLARFRGDGVIEFLGRLDHQVKVRGFRIELGEIESVLNVHPTVAQAVVTAWDDGAGGKYLAAHVRSTDGTTPEPGALDPAALRRYLGERLPNYMIPAAFVPVDSFPLTPNGKVDRKRLPDPALLSTTASVQLVAPRTPLEVTLVACWEKVLNRHPIGVDDNFFQIGGHSLAAARLFVEIEARTGRRLPLATLFQAPTVAQLATVMQRDGWTPPWSPLVPIQPQGSRPPFFCVHGFGGDVVGYHDLAHLLDPDQPFYGLQARGLDGSEPPHTSVESMAADYVRAIRTVQPHGPYHVGGYCYGGVVAYEMARQLVAAGEPVALVAILEGYALSRAESQRQLWRPRALGRFLRNLPYWAWDNFSPTGPYARGWRSLRRDLADGSPQGLSDGPEQRFDWAWRNARRGGGDHTPYPRRRLEDDHDAAIAAYMLQPFPGRVTLLRVRAMSLFRAHDPAMGWGRYAQGGVTVRLVPGAHYNILEQPHVAGLAEQLQGALTATR